MNPWIGIYIGLRVSATWHLAWARTCLRAAGGLGPLPHAQVIDMEARRQSLRQSGRHPGRL